MTMERRNQNAIAKPQDPYLTLPYPLSQTELLVADESSGQTRFGFSLATALIYLDNCCV